MRVFECSRMEEKRSYQNHYTRQEQNKKQRTQNDTDCIHRLGVIERKIAVERVKEPTTGKGG